MMTRNQVSSSPLFLFYREEQSLKVTYSKAIVIVSLDEFVEQSRSIVQWLREDLEEVTILVKVNQNMILP